MKAIITVIAVCVFWSAAAGAQEAAQMDEAAIAIAAEEGRWPYMGDPAILAPYARMLLKSRDYADGELKRLNAEKRKTSDASKLSQLDAEIQEWEYIKKAIADYPARPGIRQQPPGYLSYLTEKLRAMEQIPSGGDRERPARAKLLAIAEILQVTVARYLADTGFETPQIPEQPASDSCQQTFD